MTVVAKERTRVDQGRQDETPHEDVRRDEALPEPIPERSSGLRGVWPEDRPLTVADLERTPDDGCRYELVNGVLVVTPPPTNTHNHVATRLSTLLEFRCPVGFAPITVLAMTIANDHHRIPDLGVVREADLSPDRKYAETPPVLAVEVASPSTYKQDRTSKLAEYAAFGIESYWIVTPDRELPSLAAYRLRDGEYKLEANVAGEEVFQTDAPFPFSLAPALLVADGERWRASLREYLD